MVYDAVTYIDSSGRRRFPGLGGVTEPKRAISACTHPAPADRAAPREVPLQGVSHWPSPGTVLVYALSCRELALG